MCVGWPPGACPVMTWGGGGAWLGFWWCSYEPQHSLNFDICTGSCSADQSMEGVQWLVLDPEYGRPREWLYPILRYCQSSSVADPVPFWPLDPDQRSGIGFFRILDLKPKFWELSDKVLDKHFYNSLKTGQTFFPQHLKNKLIFSFEKFVATIKES